MSKKPSTKKSSTRGPWTTATGFVDSTSNSHAYHKKRNFFAKLRGKAPNMTSLVSGRNVAGIMHSIFKGDGLAVKHVESLDVHKAEQMCAYIQTMFPTDDGWEIVPEITLKDDVMRRKSRLDVLVRHADGKQFVVIEAKTGRVSEADHMRTYKKEYKKEIKYIAHQKQLVFQLKLLAAVQNAAGNTDADISGAVLYAGGDTVATTFLKLYEVDSALNNDAFAGIGTQENTEAVLKSFSVFRHSDAYVGDTVLGEPVRQVLPVDIGRNEAPSHCAVTDTGLVVGLYAYSIHAPPLDLIASALGIVSPCAERIVVSAV